MRLARRSAEGFWETFLHSERKASSGVSTCHACTCELALYCDCEQYRESGEMEGKGIWILLKNFKKEFTYLFQRERNYEQEEGQRQKEAPIEDTGIMT